MRSIISVLAGLLIVPFSMEAANSTILGWNNLGMHCMDSDYSGFFHPAAL